MRKRSPKPDRVQFGPDEIDYRAGVPAVDRWKPMARGEKVENWRTAFDRVFPMGFLPIDVVIGYAALQSIDPASVLESPKHCPLWFPNEDGFPRVNERRLDGPQILASVVAGIQRELWRGSHKVRGFLVHQRGDEWHPADVASDIDPAAWTTLALDHGETFGQIAAFQIWDQAVERGETATPNPASQRPDRSRPVWIGLLFNADDVIRTVEGGDHKKGLSEFRKPTVPELLAPYLRDWIAAQPGIGNVVLQSKAIHIAQREGWIPANQKTISDSTFKRAMRIARGA
jgi:hypothetical protein